MGCSWKDYVDYIDIWRDLQKFDSFCFKNQKTFYIFKQNVYMFNIFKYVTNIRPLNIQEMVTTKGYKVIHTSPLQNTKTYKE